jgi:hypothetical protein
MCGRYTDTKRIKALLASAGYQADLVFAPRVGWVSTFARCRFRSGVHGEQE